MMPDTTTDWISAVGVFFAAVAAAIALFTAITAKLQMAESISATKRQAAAAAVQELIRDYATVEMLKALQLFKFFVNKKAGNKEKFDRINNLFRKMHGKLDNSIINNPDFLEMIEQIDCDEELKTARRQINHHFKRVWALRKAEVIKEYVDLYIVTKANGGFALWNSSIVPLTAAIVILQKHRDEKFEEDEKWQNELIDWVNEAYKKINQPSKSKYWWNSLLDKSST